MAENGRMRSEQFLMLYRRLEGALEKRSGGRQSSSVVMDYIRDEDSEPFRYELNVCREIRNLLSHNADGQGEPVVEPSASMLESLEKIVEYVSSPRLAVEYGTPVERVMTAHANDRVHDVMRRMQKCGYSHVPVVERGRMNGVFSANSLFNFLERNGLGALCADVRIGDICDELVLERHGSEKYRFMARSATIVQVRQAFETKAEKNSRLSAVFITENGNPGEALVAMLTPWDALKDSTNGE